MKFSVFIILSGLSTFAFAVPVTPSSHIVHERRELQVEQWIKRDVRVNRDARLPLSIGLTQRNLDLGYEFLMDVSHPSSPNYGKHWSMDKIADTFAASEETVESVKSWLMASGIEDSRIKLSNGRNWLKLDVTVQEAEALLHTEYNIYAHHKTGQDHLGCEDYKIPQHLREHIDFVTPTVHFDAIVTPIKAKKRSIKQSNDIYTNMRLGSPDLAPKPDAALSLATCDTTITPDCLRALYGFPNGSLALSSYGIVELSPNTFVQTDLNSFYSQFAREVPSGTGPVLNLADGATIPTRGSNPNNNGESDLDLQYAIALVFPQKVTLYQIGVGENGDASFNTWLDAVDGSYCTSGGGDNPEFDPAYRRESCGTFAPAAVFSVSYGSDEAIFPASYLQRQCNEYMKLGLAGSTILYSSGDAGVAGQLGQCCSRAGCAGGSLTGQNANSGTFNPTWPGTCPFVTSVGATQVKPGTSVTATSPEEACATEIFSGGGFSNVFPLPSYQASAVASYFANHRPSFSATQYNNSQTTRGYPDVSANGAFYATVIDGVLEPVFGTSASSPTFGSIITLINNERAAAGKSSVGFINPVMYENPSAFTDITSGSNPGCGTNGFTAVEGWDPVTGLGTPNYPALLNVFTTLP
ncbi:peptidase S8/S53 domain-containing protein [Xylogone sp. PMI_703]|nr:peptidase S8/S53 domain-containing protein [Xylogone sp. PMI_703]